MTISSVLFIFIVCVGFDLDFDFNCCQIPFKNLFHFIKCNFVLLFFVISVSNLAIGVGHDPSRKQKQSSSVIANTCSRNIN